MTRKTPPTMRPMTAGQQEAERPATACVAFARHFLTRRRLGRRRRRRFGCSRRVVGGAEPFDRGDCRAGEVAVTQPWLELVGDDRVDLGVGDRVQPVGDPDRVGTVLERDEDERVVCAERVDARGLSGVVRCRLPVGRVDEQHPGLDAVVLERPRNGVRDIPRSAVERAGMVRHRPVEGRRTLRASGHGRHSQQPRHEGRQDDRAKDQGGRSTHRAVSRRDAAAGFIVEERPCGRVTACPWALQAGTQIARSALGGQLQSTSSAAPASARRRPASEAPRTRIRSVFVARPASSPHSLVILRTCRHVVEGDARQSIALRSPPPFPDPLGQPDATPDRAAAIGLDVANDEHHHRVVGQDRAQVPRARPEGTPDMARGDGRRPAWHRWLRASYPRNHVRSQL